MTTKDDRTKGGVSAFAANLIGLFETVDQCLQQQLVLPTLALIYTGIDVVSSLECVPNEHVQDYFTRWVEKYLLPELDSGITAIDIYAARCGILHTFSGSSRLSSQGKARQIAYAWGTASVAELRRAAIGMGKPMPALHLTQFAKAYRKAVAAWIEDVSADPAKVAVVESRSESQWLRNLTRQQIAAYNRISRKGFRTDPSKRVRGAGR